MKAKDIIDVLGWVETMLKDAGKNDDAEAIENARYILTDEEPILSRAIEEVK